MINKCEYCGAIKPEVLSGIRLTATTPPSLTEQARQLVEDWLAACPYGFPSDDPKALAKSADYKFHLIKRIASFAAEAATQGQTMMAGRAVEAIREWEGFRRMAANNTSYLDGYRERMAEHADAADEIRSIVESLSPDPNFPDRIRNEAVEAALEQAAQAMCSLCAQRIPTRMIEGSMRLWHWKEGGEPHQCEAAPIRKLIAAIGDDKEQQP